MHNFCAICGVYIQETSIGPGDGWMIENSKWHERIRAVRAKNGEFPPLFTGVGCIDSSGMVTVPPTNQDPNDEMPIPFESYVPFYSCEADSWTFIFHGTCWEVLVQRISWKPSDTTQIATILFNTLYCSPWRARCVQPGHDFGGASMFQKTVGNPFQKAVGQGFAHFAVEPSEFTNVDDLLGSLSPIRPDQETFKAVELKKPMGSDIFSKLPSEIVYLLLATLPSRDVQHLRIASKAAACISSIESLPQSFWYSRFCADFEMGFALPKTHGDHQDWRALYLGIKHALQHSPGSARLRNRRRIWEVVGKSVPLFSLFLGGIKLQGVPMSWEDLSALSHSTNSARVLRPVKIVTAQLETHRAKSLRFGSREIFIRGLHWPSSRSSLYAIGIHTTIFNSRKYISGIRFLYQDCNTAALTNECLGYITSTSEFLLEIRPGEEFAGFEVAISVDGILGLRLVLEAGSKRSTSSWAGDVHKFGSDVAFGVLSSEHGCLSSTFGASFDAFRMVALAILQVDSSDFVDDMVASSTTSNHLKLIPQPIWTPYCPEVTTLVEEPIPRTYQTFNPILNIDFGGSDGRNLQQLTRMVAHIGDKAAFLLGFTFHLDSHPPLFYGRQGNMELSFLIDGSRGERIAEVTYGQASTCRGIRSLNIRTNFGRQITFSPDELRPHESDPVSPFPLIDFRCVEKEETNPVSLRPKDGQVIIGFTSILEAWIGSFQTFDLQCSGASDLFQQSAASQGTNDDPDGSSAYLWSSVGPRLMGTSGCTSYTSAPLNGVRCIRFSCGSAGRPRESKEISGLWLDYIAPQPSAIVGQWISEIDMIELDPAETVIEISFGISRLGYSFEEKYPLGRVAWISMLTSRMRSKTVRGLNLVSTDECIELKFKANKFEELTAVLWAFKARWDHPRVLSSPVADSRRLVLWDANSYFKIPWVAPDKILWEDLDLKGQPDKVISIKAYRNSTHRGQYITGLAFKYQSQAVRTLGHAHGEFHFEILLEADWRLDILKLVSDRSGLLEIKSRSEIVDAEGQKRTEALALASGTAMGSESTTYHELLDFSALRYEFRINENGLELDTERELKDLPNQQAIGLCGFNFDTDGKLNIGVVYLEETALC